jgi:hypothetical protein
MLWPLSVTVSRTYQLALGGKRHFRLAGEAAVERFVFQAHLAGGNDQRAFKSDRRAPTTARHAPATPRCWRDRRQ